MTITVTGANGNVVSINSGVGRVTTFIQDGADAINNSIANGNSEVFDLTPSSGNPSYTTGTYPVGIVQEAGSYNVPNAYRYIVVADDGEGTDSGAVTLNSNGFSLNTISILSGRTSGLTYNASNESGLINSTAGNLAFNGVGKTGEWTINSSVGNATINGTNGNNQFNTSTGKNTIVLGSGSNVVYSQGQDTITGGQGGYNSITLNGSKSDVTVGDNSLVTDIGTSDNVTVGKNSTITGGTNGTALFNNGGNQNQYNGGVNQTVTGTNGSEIRFTQGTNTTFNVDGNATFLNPNGKTTISSSAQAVVFGAKKSSFTLNATGDSSGLFVADTGNQTLSASGSTAALAIYANTISGGNNNFVATGGSGNDLLVAGVGNETFTGGAGDNLFVFSKDTSNNGNTVITDFGNSSGNKISIYNYGVDSSNIQQLLDNSKNDASNNAVISLEGHTITLEGVSVSSLNTSMFNVDSNATAKTA